MSGLAVWQNYSRLNFCCVFSLCSSLCSDRWLCVLHLLTALLFPPCVVAPRSAQSFGVKHLMCPAHGNATYGCCHRAAEPKYAEIASALLERHRSKQVPGIYAVCCSACAVKPCRSLKSWGWLFRGMGKPQTCPSISEPSRMLPKSALLFLPLHERKADQHKISKYVCWA